MAVKSSNPTIAPFLRVMFVVIAIVEVAGASLFFAPDLVGPKWPWKLAPFNARFLGTIYLAELLAVVIVIIANRWSPLRLILPSTFSAFWPWKIDDFHGRMYSAIFFGVMVGMLVLSRAGSTLEFFTLGITQVLLGLFSVLGLIIVDASVHRINWSSPSTWLWIAGFGVLFVAGAAMVRRYTAMNRLGIETRAAAT